MSRNYLIKEKRRYREPRWIQYKKRKLQKEIVQTRSRGYCGSIWGCHYMEYSDVTIKWKPSNINSNILIRDEDIIPTDDSVCN